MIYRAVVFIDDDELEVRKMDVVLYRDKYWLVPSWLESTTSKVQRPERLILLDTFQHQKCIGSPAGDFVVNDALPRALVDGADPSLVGPQYVVIDSPEIEFPFTRPQ